MLKNITKGFVIILTMMILTACVSETPVEHEASDYQLIPLPAQLQAGAGYFTLDENTRVVGTSDSLTAIANYMIDWVNEHTPVELIQHSSGKGDVMLSIDPFLSSKESYKLVITQKGVLLQGKTVEACFRGLQTLLQLIAQQTGQDSLIEIPCVYIEDKPSFNYRGMHLDVARHFFSVESVKKYIDVLAFYKMNRFHWHLTEDQGWRIEIKQYPKLQEIAAYRKETLIGHYSDQPHQFDGKRYGGYYTQEEVKEVVAYAKERHITIIPEIEMPGHSSAALAAYPELGCSDGPFEVATKWGVFEDVYCPKEETFEFLENVLTEVMALFPSEYNHIGGDECPKTAWKNSEFCQELMQSEGLADENELQSYFIKRMENFLNENGRQIIGWDEILEGGLAPNATVMSWRGEKGGIEAAEAGHDVVMTPTSHCYLDYYQSDHPDEPLAIGGFLPLEKVYSYHPVPASLDNEAAKHILGVQGNVWTEYMPTYKQVEYMAFPRALALAEIGWTPKGKKDFESFSNRVFSHISWLNKQGINAANRLFDVQSEVISGSGQEVRVKFDKPVKQGIIRYALAPNEISDSSTAFVNPILMQNSGTLIAQTYVNSNPIGYPTSLTYTHHKGAGKEIELINEPHPTYNAGGPSAVINGISGSNKRYGDKEWLGFTTDFEAVIDLGKIDTVSAISFRFHNGKGQWIYAPKETMISFGAEKDSFSEPVSTTIGESKDILITHKMSFDKQTAQFIKIKIPNFGIIPEGAQGEGNQAWLFVDEIMIE
ncbi:MAG: beta-N-acetylhexosaminidase [Bacteroidota bacterium]